MGGALLDRRLALESFGNRRIGLHIIRADGTPGCQAGNEEGRKGVFWQHG
jgi:hypothetical protein